MTIKPDYFEEIRGGASDLWAQLEGNKKLAGPWHQLFNQVQSPKHVLSELLQNADDAGATEATVRIEGSRFTFRHNGRDFTREEFDSLCSFGNSNKRVLHTIGFRGIGFKSTFSLGDIVALRTRTLSVEFNKQRFTEPNWVESDHEETGTEIGVAIVDRERQNELEASLDAWIKSPTSLLFFKNIRHLQIRDDDLHWKTIRPGPVGDSEWVALDGSRDEGLLIITSTDEPFPSEALDEIRQVRNLSDADVADFPQCKVEIVVGVPGTLYVVLPTGVKTPLPFACNAPFIQDPARLQIKSPETSPTNRWLLARAGRLAAKSMCGWLNSDSLSTRERSRAYALLPSLSSLDGSLENACGDLVSSAFDGVIAEADVLLTDEGHVVRRGDVVYIAEDLLEVWPNGQATSILDPAHRSALCRHISAQHRAQLIARKFASEIARSDVMDALEATTPPRPTNWRRLMTLWSYLAPGLSRSRASGRERNLRIVPTRGSATLYGSADVVRLGEKRVLHSDDDWIFLSDQLHVADPRWFRFLADARRRAGKVDETMRSTVDGALTVLAATGLDEASDADKIIERVASVAFARQGVSLADCVRIAQIAATLRVTIGDSFRFATKDRGLHGSTDTIVADTERLLEPDLPADWCLKHLLHPDYTSTYASCTAEEWARWVSSGSARLHRFPPFGHGDEWLWGRANLEAWLRRRGAEAPDRYPYKSENFQIRDWDFAEEFWKHWNDLAANDPAVWGRLAKQLFSQRSDFWSRCQAPTVWQQGGGYTKVLKVDAAISAWVVKLRELQCIPDRAGVLRKPIDLLRYNGETEPLLKIEPFVDLELDTEANRPLLRLLGVGETAPGPRRLLDDLRSRTLLSSVSAAEVASIYAGIDAMTANGSAADFTQIESAFRDEPLVLTDSGEWVTTTDVYLSPEDGALPGARTILAASRHLGLWRRIGVTEHATPEHAIGWLTGLTPSVRLERDVVTRVESLLHQYGPRVWEECGHWLTLAQTWAPVETIRYSVSMGSLTRVRDLHDWVKEQTADFKRLPKELLGLPPFANLTPLAACIEERVREDQIDVVREERREWLSRLGDELCRTKPGHDADTGHTLRLASELAKTTWKVVRLLELTPYIDGMEAGDAAPGAAKWVGRSLYVEDRSAAKLASAVAEELGRSFDSDKIADAIKFCFDRPPRYVSEYMEENFDLKPRIQNPSRIDSSTDAPANGAPLGSGEVAGTPGPHRAAVAAENKASRIYPEPIVDPSAADRAIDLLKDRLVNRLRSANGAVRSAESTSFEENDDELPPSVELPPLTDVRMTEVPLADEWRPAVAPGSERDRRGRQNVKNAAQTEGDARVGRRGEELVFEYERARIRKLGFSEDRLEWTSDRDETADHDIRSVDDDGADLWIEVKSTVGQGRHFFWSIAEFERAVREGPHYAIYRVYDVSTTTPQLAIIRDPIERLARDEMRLEVDGFRGELPAVGSHDLGGL